ncbi:Glycerol-3-phosphate ABC transporter, ATP-binding protein UgpC [Minicystis rosea]|nr:Glycerol-3-phosphate ABC transporter, ATP-binding protein UgpC [Minicystis rosea]
MATVKLRGLRRHFQGVETAALRGLDLEVESGELLVLVGPSGCGKSTALRLIAGLDRPDGGSIAIGDRNVDDVPPQDRDVAMVFQGYALYPHLTARDNIAFPLKMRGIAPAERARRVEEAAGLLGLARLLDRRPGELSGGERQRVAMGRAIVRRPKVFLFDEPLSNLDAALRTELRVEIAALVRRLGVTSLYVTHDQVEAMTMGDRIAVLRAGELQQLGAPREIYQDPANTFVAGFLGSPPINWIDVERGAEGLVGAGAVWPAPPGLDLPAKVKAGLRPEHLSLRGPGIPLKAKVVQIEPLGAETHVLLDAQGTALRAKAPGFDAPARGAEVSIFAQVDAVLWFDATTGKRVR